MNDLTRDARPSAWALSPLLLFLALFFGAGLYFTAQGNPMGFYQLHAPVAILPALALGLWIAHRRGVKAMDTLLAGISAIAAPIYDARGHVCAVLTSLGASNGFDTRPGGKVCPSVMREASAISAAMGYAAPLPEAGVPSAT